VAEGRRTGPYIFDRGPIVPPIFHFTDIANLSSILAAGELRCHSTANCSVDVADATIKSRRMSKRVPCGPGGAVGDYVPFYFAPRSPMLFRIQHGGVADVSSDPARLVYVVSSTEAVLAAGHDFVFTDGNAAAAFTEFHDDADSLGEVVDWPLMKATMWANTPADPDRRRRRGAEFLVHQALPFELVDRLCVHDADARSSVAAEAADADWEVKVRIRGGWYF
jgi:ssDNA thymidine ADP-ribosyltransferase, DarT